MGKKRLILFVGVYDTLDIFTYELQKAFIEMGYETMLYDSRQTRESLLALSEFIKEPVVAALTFNNLGFNMELAEGHNIWEELQIPCINILMDHPFCYKKALDEAPSNAIVLCTDRNHMRYLTRFYPQISTTGFLPHAGKVLPGIKKPLEQRSIDVMYAGNLSKSFAKNIIPDLSGYTSFDVDSLCHSIYEEMIAHPEKTTEQGIEECLLAEGISLSEPELCQVISDLHFLDLYVVSYYREQVMAAVARAGISLDLFGAGWEGCDWIHLPNVHYHGKVAADEVVCAMQEAKIVLSTMTWFKDGTHDRIFNGMLQKAVVVSDSSLYMSEAFCSGDEQKSELILFELTEIAQLPAKIQYLLEHLPEAQKIADCGYERAMRSETWAARAKELDEDLISQLMPAPKILVVTHQLSRTGAPIVLMDMVRLCQKMGFMVDVITMQDGPLRGELEQLGIDAAICEHFWEIREEFRTVASEYQLVIANTLITYEAVWALNHTDTPVLWWLHEGEQYFEYFKTVLPDFSTMGDNIHAYAVGHYVQDVVRKRYGAEIPILHFAVDEVKKEKINITSSKMRFLTAGTYSSVKGQDILAAAIRLLPVSYLEQTEFYFCGNEELVDEQIYQKVCQLQQEYENVILLHQLSREETLQWMKDADCLVIPSRIDPIPTVAVEMLMQEGVVLCTDVCGIAHYIRDGENGYTIPAENPKALAQKIMYLIDHKENLQNIGQMGRKIYEEHFAVKIVEQQMQSILQDFIG